MNRMIDLVKNSLYLYISQGLNFLLPFFVLPYLLTTLSVESFGIYSFAFAFSQFCLLFVDFGFNISATKKIAENSSGTESIVNYFWTIISIKFVFFLISCSVGTFIVFAIPSLNIYKSAVLLSFLMVLGNVFTPLWWFQGRNIFRPLALISITSKILTYPLIFYFVITKEDYLIAIFIQSLSYIINAFLSFLYFIIYESYYFTKFSFKEVKNNYKKEVLDAWPIFLSNSSISLYTTSMVIMLGSVGTSYNVGVFSAIERIVRILSTAILVPLNQACFPFLINLKKEDYKSAKKFFMGILLVTLIIISLIIFLYFIFRSSFLQYFFKDYLAKSSVLDIFLFLLFPIAIGSIFGHLGLLALGGEREKKVFSKIYIFIGLFTLPFSILLINYFLESGAFISVFLIELIVCFSMVTASVRMKVLQIVRI